MELRYPYFIIIVFIITIVCLFLFKRKDTKFNIGSKIANTSYVKNSSYYKYKMKQYKFFKYFIYILFFFSFLCSSTLISRLSYTEVVSDSQFNRDIYLCMDVSTSVDDLNIELVDSLQNTVKKLHGERFGISIFNTTSVVLVPLTDDYDYVLSVLEQIRKSIKVNNSSRYGNSYDDDYLYSAGYLYSGTIEGNEIRGSSLIGDGLASCVYNFSSSDNDRTKIIIFSTDNDLAGTPIFTLDKAAKLSKSKNIKVFGIGTKLMKNSNRQSFMNAVSLTGGKYYDHSSKTVDNIVSDIELTSKSLIKKNVEKKKVDIPEFPFILLFFSVSLIIIISRKVRL